MAAAGGLQQQGAGLAVNGRGTDWQLGGAALRWVGRLQWYCGSALSEFWVCVWLTAMFEETVQSWRTAMAAAGGLQQQGVNGRGRDWQLGEAALRCVGGTFLQSCYRFALCENVLCRVRRLGRLLIPGTATSADGAHDLLSGAVNRTCLPSQTTPPTMQPN
jgi:hypothetical protein